LNDNYGFLIHDPATSATATIDTPEATAINKELRKKKWALTHIFNTHHHFDHAGGNVELKKEWNCEIVGAAIDGRRIPGLDRKVVDGQTFQLGEISVRVLEVPGHTTGHIAYYFAGQKVVFVGDTIFAMGCGRLFEGTADQMWSSLNKLMDLPIETKIYCAHEYTESNADFAISIDPRNQDLIKRVAEVKKLRLEGLATVPTYLGLEQLTNPFLRADNNELKKELGMEGCDAGEVFAMIRKLKDNF